MHSLKSLWKGIRSLFSRIRTILLLSYFVIILLCIGLVGTISFYISYRSTSERVETASFQIVRQIEKNMDNNFNNKRNLLLAPYYNSENIDSINLYRKMDDQSKFVFRQKLADLYLKIFNTTPIPDFIRFEIYYSGGEFLNASDNSPHASPEEVRQSNWYRQTLDKDGKVHFFSPDASPFSEGRPVSYSMSILIRDFANPVEFIVVRADYSAELFYGIGENADITQGSGILILDEKDRTVFVSSDRLMEQPELPFLAGLTGEGGKFWSETGGDKVLVSYTRSAYSDWKVILVMPKKEIFSPLEKIKTAVFFTALFAFAITSLISLLFGRSITKPILKLYKTVNHIKRGDFSVRVDSSRTDEIGRIAMNFNDMQDELQKLIETKYIYQIKLQEVELAMLYSQINPHFLYNTLDSIKAMADYYHVTEIGEMSQSLADMFRYNTKSSEDIVTLREELEQIAAYMKIQSIRFEDRINFELDIEEELNGYPLLKMTLQPLVENAVFHGFERKRGKVTIRIIARKEGNRFLLTVSDNGVGISEERLEEIRKNLRKPFYQEEFSVSPAAGGIGIQNVYARYSIRYGARFEFRIESKENNGTDVMLQVEEL